MGKKKLDRLKKNHLKKNINLALDWLTKSGIQNINKKKIKEFGAFNAWFDPKSKKYSYMYSEITGYLITSMVYHYKVTKKKIFLKSAINAADWLIYNAQDKEGGFKCLFLINKNLKYTTKETLSYSFDNGVIINGLVNLYNVTKIKKYLYAAEKTVNFLILNCLKKNNEVRPVYDLSKKKFILNTREWSLIPGSYHTKISMGILNLYKTTKNKKYLKISKKILNSYLKKQKTNGEFVSTKYNTNLHPHCYSLEGYWCCGNYLKISKYKDVSLKGVRWIVNNINSDGLPPRINFKNNFNFYERLDILSQSLRLIVLYQSKLNLKKTDKIKIEKLVSIILKYQETSNSNIKIKGGFSWGKTSNGKNTNHINTWVTAFSVQALSILSDNKSKKILKSNPFYLI